MTDKVIKFIYVNNIFLVINMEIRELIKNYVKFKYKGKFVFVLYIYMNI